MADYTTQLRTICEFYSGNTQSQGYEKIDEIVETSAPKIFEPFEIFDEDYRIPLEKKILRHFYTREICMETVGLWKLHFNNKMNEIMPYYNQLYKSALLDFNPFYDVDLTREHTRTNDGETKSEGTSDTKVDNTLDRHNDGTQDTKNKTSNDRNLFEKTKREQETEEIEAQTGQDKRTANLNTEYKPTNYKTHELNKFLDTPQGGQTVNNGTLGDSYLTDVRDITRTETGSTNTKETGTDTHDTKNDTTTTMTNDDTHKRDLSDSSFEENSRFNKYKDNTSEVSYGDTKAKTNSNTKTNNMEDFFEKIRGKQGTKSYSKMLQEFRETFLNIDMMIIKDLEPLFFQLW